MGFPAKITFKEQLEKQKEYMKEVIKFINGKVGNLLNLTEGYGHINEDFFEENFRNNIRSPSSYNKKIYSLDYVFTRETESAMGRPGDHIGVADPTGRRGAHIHAKFCGVKIVCPECNEIMQLIQHKVILRKMINEFLISIRPDLICCECETNFRIADSKLDIVEV